MGMYVLRQSNLLLIASLQAALESDGKISKEQALALGSVNLEKLLGVQPSGSNGDLVVTRLVGGAGFNCKELVFSVDTIVDKIPIRSFYTTTVCQDGADWKWASAEPATARWGSLQ